VNNTDICPLIHVVHCISSNIKRYIPSVRLNIKSRAASLFGTHSGLGGGLHPRAHMPQAKLCPISSSISKSTPSNFFLLLRHLSLPRTCTTQARGRVTGRHHGSAPRNLHSYNHNLHHLPTAYNLQHNPPPSTPLLRHRQALFRLHSLPQRTNIANKQPTTNPSPTEILVLKHGLQHNPPRIPPREPRILPPRHKRIR
jgi:hypothetical protein